MGERLELLEDLAGVGAARARRVVVNEAGLIAAIHVLTGGTDSLGRARYYESDRGNGAVTCPDEGVSPFGTLSEDVINQAGLRGRSGAGIRAAESGQLCREAEVRIGDGVSDCGSIDHAKGGHCGSFIGAETGAKEIRNGYCRDD